MNPYGTGCAPCFFEIVLFSCSATLPLVKVLVIGVNGMLGGDLTESCRTSGIEVAGVDWPDIDLTRPETLETGLPHADWYVNCAAYTRVDDAENDRDAAFAVNATGAGHLARIAAARGVALLHLSTDYVFDGRATRPYMEEDATHPLNVYGESKWAGEGAVHGAGGWHLIVRTQSLFGHRGPNFVKAIVRKIKEDAGPISVVDDQISAPTYTRHLAGALMRLMRAQAQGTVHVTASDTCSWFAFAQAVVEQIRPGYPVEAIPSSQLQRPAARPRHAVLSTERYERLTGHIMPSWREGLEAYIEEEGHFL